MKKIAIDIVIIPPENIIEKCIALNNSSKIRKFQLWKNDFVPHISLTLLGIYEKNLNTITKIISQVDVEPFPIYLTWIGSVKKEKWDYHIIHINTSEKLKELHKYITQETLAYFEKADTPEMIVAWKETWWNESSKKWINNFYTEHSFEKYKPHITLWCYNLNTPLIDEFPIKFYASKICVFQVWNSNTCRKLLWEKNI